MTTRRPDSPHGRWLRAGGLLGALAALALGWVEMLERARQEHAAQGPRDAPWHFPAIASAGLRELHSQASEELLPLLFVTRTCHWCRQELQMWASTIGSEARSETLGMSTRPWIFSLDDAGAPNSTAWLPEALRHRWRPAGHELAELAGVTRVPTTLWIDALDTVRLVVVGPSHPDAGLTHLRRGSP